MGKTAIEWTDATWNPVTGCTKVSLGCKNCYAERVFPRPYPGRKFTDVHTHPDRLRQPLSWRKPRRIFVNSMSDLFHENISTAFLDEVFAVMANALRHTFQILTKRPQRMHDYLTNRSVRESIQQVARCTIPAWPLPNVWLGVSVEDQETADARIPLLRRTPAAVRFLSCEPVLSHVDLSKWLPDNRQNPPLISWAIVGGESGPCARPMDLDWVRSIRNECIAAGVPFFFKQGSAANWPDFKSFASFPEDLQIREFPCTHSGSTLNKPIAGS